MFKIFRRPSKNFQRRSKSRSPACELVNYVGALKYNCQLSTFLSVIIEFVFAGGSNDLTVLESPRHVTVRRAHSLGRGSPRLHPLATNGYPSGFRAGSREREFEDDDE